MVAIEILEAKKADLQTQVSVLKGMIEGINVALGILREAKSEPLTDIQRSVRDGTFGVKSAPDTPTRKPDTAEDEPECPEVPADQPTPAERPEWHKTQTPVDALLKRTARLQAEDKAMHLKPHIVEEVARRRLPRLIGDDQVKTAEDAYNEFKHLGLTRDQATKVFDEIVAYNESLKNKKSDDKPTERPVLGPPRRQTSHTLKRDEHADLIVPDLPELMKSEPQGITVKGVMDWLGIQMHEAREALFCLKERGLGEYGRRPGGPALYFVPNGYKAEQFELPFRQKQLYDWMVGKMDENRRVTVVKADVGALFLVSGGAIHLTLQALEKKDFIKLYANSYPPVYEVTEQ